MIVSFYWKIENDDIAKIAVIFLDTLQKVDRVKADIYIIQNKEMFFYVHENGLNICLLWHLFQLYNNGQNITELDQMMISFFKGHVMLSSSFIINIRYDHVYKKLN